MNPISEKAYNLLHEGSLAFAKAEENGIKMNVPYLRKTADFLEKKENELTKKIFSSKAGRVWRSLYGGSSKLGSGDQLKIVLKKEFGIHIQDSVDKNALAGICEDFVIDILEWRKINKARTTYIKGLLNEVIDGYIQPSFNLHTTQTYRSSASNPNFQNIPIRDPWVSKMIRRAFIPRSKKNVLVEIDYSGVEVRIAACYHQDPKMIHYLETGYDMHKEMAAECYACKKEQVSKMMRYCAKNRFVFPEFYGSYWKNVGPDLWNAIDEFSLTLEDGTPLHSFLRKKDLSDKDNFMMHIKKVENNFWYKKFAQYTQWKKDWLQAYIAKGWFRTKTDFVCRGYMKRNEVINYPVQGSAFHCLLWAFIETTKELERRKMKSLLVGQIHDSVIADVPLEELDDFAVLFEEIATRKIREYWDWIILPLEVEIEVTDPGKSWYTKKEYKV